MDFCIGTCAKIDQVGMARQAEDVGVTHFGVGEGPLLFSDPYQFMALAATQTSTINLGTMVTNPLTRIAPVTANSIATLNAIAPGRTFLGIGTANNALRSMGHRPASMKELEDHIRVTKALLARSASGTSGAERSVRRSSSTTRAVSTTPTTCPSGWRAAARRASSVAARYADAIIYCLGPNTDMIRLIKSEIEKAVAEAGRPRGVGQADLALVVLQVPGSRGDLGGRHRQRLRVRPDQLVHHQRRPNERARRRARCRDRGGLHQGRDGLSRATRPPPTQPHYLETWAKYLRGLDPKHRPIITQELVDYWCLYGSPEDLQEKSQLMLDAGVDMLSVFLSNPFTAERDIADIGSAILAHA